MEKTHYEMMLSEWSSISKSFDILKQSLLKEGFTWEEFMGTKTMQEHARYDLVYGARNVMTSAQILFHTYSYYIGKGRTYRICDDIAEMLLNTKLDIDTCMVKSPFREIQLVLPSEIPLLNVYNESTGYHKAAWIYVNFHEDLTHKMVRILIVGKPNESSVHKYDDAIFYFRVPLYEGKVDQSLKLCLENWKNDPLHETFAAAKEEEMLPRIFHFVLNVLLYLTSHDADIIRELTEGERLVKKKAGMKSSGKIKRIDRKLSGLSKIPVYYVGKNIQLSSEERELYRNTGSKHSVRYPVGGHWRMQWYGPKDSQYQKQIWIRPYFRGPELAELIKSTGVIQ